MTDKKNQPVTITIMRSGFSVPDEVGDKWSSNRSRYRGEVVTLSPEQVAETLNRNGESWLDMTEDDQLARWGEIQFLHGDHSAEVKFIGDDDSTVIFRRRENAMIAARKIADPAERREALREINELYGAAPSSQHSVSYGG